MNKKELSVAVAEKAEISHKEAGCIIDAAFEAIKAAVAAGEDVRIFGFGSFVPRKRAKRKVRNPQNGKAITVAAKTVPAFRAAKAFKEAVDVKPAKRGKKK